jgi:hypothetical protein
MSRSRRSLPALPASRNDRETLHAVTLWKHGDVSSFASLAAVVVGTRPEVQHAIQRLNWLHAAVDRLRESSRDDVKVWDRFSWEEWNRQLGEAKAALQNVRADARDAEPQGADSSVQPNDAETQKS